MNTDHLKRKFEALGARVKFGERHDFPHLHTAARGVARSNGFTIDVSRDGHGQFFDIRVSAREKVQFAVLETDRKGRHLLLMSKADATPYGRLVVQKFLCGHDERFWFVAAVPGRNVCTVSAAKNALKPASVTTAELKHHVKLRDSHRHRNKAFVRQGEWFFIPAPDLVPDEKHILRREPLRRGSGKPHVAQYLVRRGGTRVYVCRAVPNGLTEEQYGALIAREPGKKAMGWRSMVRDPEAYVKGRITHPDHRTICLPFWHRVMPNTEVVSQNMAFLD